MKTIKKMGAQGDVMFRRVAKLPPGVREIKRSGPIVVAHSETGHHHVIDAPHVRHYESDNPLIGYVVDIPGTRAPVDVEHRRTWDTHETIRLLNDEPSAPAVWQIIREREWIPESWQRAQD